MTGLVPIPYVSDTCYIYDGDTNCRILYTIWVFVFAAFVIPLTLMEFKAQAWIQVASTVLKSIFVGLMIVFSLYLILVPREENDSYPRSAFPFVWNWEYFGSIFAIVSYCSDFHPNIPIITHNLENREKNAGSLFVAALLGNTIFLFFFGFIICSGFGYDISEQANLNWSYYTTNDNFHIALVLLSGLILLSPSLNGGTSFPIRAIVYAESLVSFWGFTLSKRNSKKIKYTFRLAVAAPPIIIACCVYNINVVMSWAGLSYFGIIYILPALFDISARKLVPKETPYQTLVSSSKWSYFLVCSSTIFCIIAISQRF
mmetsp:Transcript_3606/g.3913  ORF Transcript_3606/g.3913 Transcript_3606/m.3913 type:complete len:315 (-) Transcript_3606:84-1028(-)